MTVSKIYIFAITIISAASLQACGTVPAEWKTGENAVATSADPDEIICRDTRMTGSSFDKKLCLPQSEWTAIAEASKKNTKRIQDSSARAIRSSGGGGG